MRLISLLSIMTLYLATGSASIMSEQQPMREGAPIRTTASWGYTDCAPPSSSIEIKSITLSPDPPKPGEKLTVTVDGLVLETLEEGAYADVSVKLGLVKILQKRFDLCEEARHSNVSVQCPVYPGVYHVEHEVYLPKEIPPAKFVVYVEGYTVKDEEVLCLHLNVDFLKRWLF